MKLVLQTEVAPPKNSLCEVALHPKAGHYFATWDGKTWSCLAFSEDAALMLSDRRFMVPHNQPLYYRVIRILQPVHTERSVMATSTARVLNSRSLSSFFGNPSEMFNGRRKATATKPVRTARKAKVAETTLAPRRGRHNSPSIPSAWAPKGRPAKSAKAARPQLTPWLNVNKCPPTMSGAYEVRMRNEGGERLVKVLKWSDDHEAFRGVPRGYTVRAYRGLTKASFKAQEALI